MADQIASQSDYLGITEAAEYLRVSASTLRRWEKKGFLIPERTPTGIRRYTKQQLDSVLQQGPQLLNDDAYEGSVETPPVLDTSVDVSTFDSHASVYAPQESSADSQYYSQQPATYTYAQQETFISSHRYSPPPTYTPPVTDAYSTPPSTSPVQNDQQTSYTPIRMPEDDIQASLNELSGLQDFHHSAATLPHRPQPVTPPVQQEFKQNIASFHESVSNDAPQQYYHPPTSNTEYLDDYDVFDEPVEEAESPSRQTIQPEVKVQRVKKSPSSGAAMFLGVFVGILLITAGIWFGFMYFSGNLGTASLLSPVP